MHVRARPAPLRFVILIVPKMPSRLQNGVITTAAAEAVCIIPCLAVQQHGPNKTPPPPTPPASGAALPPFLGLRLPPPPPPQRHTQTTHHGDRASQDGLNHARVAVREDGAAVADEARAQLSNRLARPAHRGWGGRWGGGGGGRGSGAARAGGVGGGARAQRIRPLGVLALARL